MDLRIGQSSVALLLVALASVLGACSPAKNDATPPAAVTPPPPAEAPAVAPAPAPVTAVPLADNLRARLVRSDSPVLGPAKAPVTIVEFLDPACGACRAYSAVVKQVMFLYPDEVRVVVRYAAFHPGSDEAIRVLEASRKQGKFAEVLTALFDRQEEWAAHGAPRPELTWDIARENGVDLARARRDASAATIVNVLNRDSDDIVALEIERTPTFFVNGKRLPDFGPQELMDLVASEVQLAKSARPAT